MAQDALRSLVATFDALISDFPQIVLVETEVAGKDILADTEDRLVQRGTDAQGRAFKDYTDDYKAKKTKLGRYRGHVDFQLTTQMLASSDSGLVNIVPSERSVKGATATVVFDGRDKLTKDKLAGNDKYRPGFMNPSKEEVDRASGFAGKRMEKRIAKRFEKFA